MNANRILTTLIVCLVFTSSCVSTTLLRTSQPGAKITVDGRYLGEESVTYSDTKVLGSATNIEIEKPGFKKKVATIYRNAQVSAGPIVGAVLLLPFTAGLSLLFLLWVQDYAPQYNFELEPEDKSRRV